MGIFGKRSKREPERLIKHPYFGDLSCREFEDGAVKGYSGSRKVPESGQEFGVMLLTDENGPNANHVKFCEHVIKNSKSIASKCQSALAAPFEKCFNKPLSRNYLSQLELFVFMVPWNADYKNPWKITFRFRSKPNLLFEVGLENGIPKQVEIKDL